MARSELVDTIVRLEWDDYARVRCIDGKASCSHQFEAFVHMRTALLSTWSGELLESYLDDVDEARRRGRSLMAERYAWMMQRTDEAGFEDVSGMLPILPYDMCERIDHIAKIFLVWQAQANVLFPHLSKNGRPLLCEDDEPGRTSFETYLRGELKSYSPRTVAIYERYVLACWYEGENLAIDNLDNIARTYGYPDAATAEERMG